MYISECAAHYFRERLEGKSRVEIEEQLLLLRQSLLALEEERAEVACLPDRAAAKLRGDLERDALMLRAKVAALEALLGEANTSGA